MKEEFKINAHGHLLPNPEEIPKFMKDQKLFWVDADRKYMRQDDWKRPIDHPSYFLDGKLEWMEKAGIDHEVILNLSQMYCNGRQKQETDDMIRFQNDFNASVQERHPKKFTAGFVVQPRDIDDALKEMDRCVNGLGLQMMCLPTHYLNWEEEWTCVVDEDTRPIFEYANELKLAVQIHPYDAPKMINLPDKFWRFHLIWMCAQTADTYHVYTLLDFDDQYKDVRTSFAHGNQFGQVNVGRRIQGFEGRPDLFENTKHPNAGVGNTNLYFDTLVHDPLSFRLLIDRQGVSQVIAGLDDPYPLGEMETVGQSYPGKVIDDAVASQVISAKQKSEIWFDNVISWLNPEEKKNQFIQRLDIENEV